MPARPAAARRSAPKPSKAAKAPSPSAGRTPGTRRAVRKAADGKRRTPPTDLRSVVADLGPHIGAAAAGLLQRVRDAHLMEGAASDELISILREAERMVRDRFPPPSPA